MTRCCVAGSATGCTFPLSNGAPLVFVDGATYLVATQGTPIGYCGRLRQWHGVAVLEAIDDAAFPG